MKLLFIFDSTGLVTYVDNILYSTVNSAAQRLYMSLKYDPVRNVKSLLDSRERTSITTALFYDTITEATTVELKGKL